MLSGNTSKRSFYFRSQESGRGPQLFSRRGWVKMTSPSQANSLNRYRSCDFGREYLENIQLSLSGSLCLQRDARGVPCYHGLLSDISPVDFSHNRGQRTLLYLVVAVCLLLQWDIHDEPRRPKNVKNPATTSAHPAPSEMPLTTSVA